MTKLYKITQTIEFTATQRDLSRILRASRKEISDAVEQNIEVNGFKIEEITIREV